MTITPEQQPGAYPPPGQPGTYPAQAPAPTTNGLAIAGLVLAVVIFPVGLVLSLIGLVQARRRKQRGTVLAVLGILIAVVELVVVVAVVATVGKNVDTVLDAGCVKGKEVILKDGDLGNGGDATLVQTKLASVVSGLDAAAKAAQHDNVRTTVQALHDDYAQLQDAVNKQAEPPADLQDKINKDAAAMDSLCTIGGAKS